MSRRTCYHCGSSTGSFVVHDGKDFCCEGCATVYDILQGNQLYTYYDLEINPGVKGPDRPVSSAYDYLDEEEIKQSVLDFYDGTLAKIRLYIPAIHCSSCIWLLENLQRVNKGVLHSSVNFTQKEVSISFDETRIKLSELMLLLESLHYRAQLQKNRETYTKKNNSGLLIKLGIAGFAFGNVMLLSFPDYLSHTLSVEDEFIRYFGWISLILTLPVLFYSASDYFLSAWKNLLKRMISIDLPIAIGILAIFLRSCFELFTRSGTGYFDSLTGLVFFLLIGKWYQDKTYKALNFESDYTAYFPLGIKRIKPEGEEIIPIKKLQRGDSIMVRNQEIVPADATLESESASIDYSFITGESIPVHKQKGDMIFAGGRQIGSAIRLEVVKEVETSYLAQLWKEKKKDREEGVFISQTLNGVSKYFTLAILSISLLTGLVWLTIDPSKAILAFTSVLIVACPCALALSAPFTFGHAQNILGRNDFYLKHSSVVEKLGRVDTLVFDKTGTLTDSSVFEVSMDESMVRSEWLPGFKALTKHSMHPLSRAIYNAIDAPEIKVNDFEETPGSGIRGTVNEMEIRIGSAEFTGMDTRRNVDSASEVYTTVNGKGTGQIRIRNIYRPNWRSLLKTLSAEYEFHLLSGDNDKEKETIAAITGSPGRLHFNQSPKDKLEYIQNLRSLGKNILMVGDGLNDSGALKASHVGISVAEDIYQFSPASDAIINAGKLEFLPIFLAFARSARSIVWICIAFSFLYNLIGIYFAARGLLSPLIAAILMPLSSVSVVILTTVLTIYSGKRKGL